MKSIAASGRASDEAYLIGTLGARSVIDRSELSQPGKSLAKERWAAAIDSVGSHTLSNMLAACGMAQGLELPASVAPFILRGVTLTGVDSVMCPKPLRQQAWQRLGELLNGETLTRLTTVVPLSEAKQGAQDLLDGKVRPPDRRLPLSVLMQGNVA
ncbi:Acrylyl-CoA reductase AcuI|nr:Acrylyl-CoA reductase AcuI [Candidatus Pantoea persica]